MKVPLKSTVMVVISLSVLSVCGQSNYDQHKFKPINKSSGTSEAIGLKNLCEKPVLIFAGPKEELDKPQARQKSYEGLSTNTIYVSTTEVVCIMHQSGRPIACADVMAGSAEMEIDEAGTAITVKE
jgi:hypothetical protein